MKTESNEKIQTAKDLGYYLSLPYTTILRRDDEGDVIARIEELQGCIAHGKDETEALSNLADMKQLWIEDCLEAGEEIPEPKEEAVFPSGRWVQRVPRSLHRELTRMAKAEGVSLNQLVTSMLSQQLSSRAVLKAVEEMLTQHSSLASWSARHYWDISSIAFQGPWSLDNPLANAGSFLKMAKLNPSAFEMETENAEDPTDRLLSLGR